MKQQVFIEAKTTTGKTVAGLAGLLLLAIALTVLVDFLEARFYKLGFYWSESLLFSLFWWLFLPLLAVQYRLAQRQSSYHFHLALAAGLMGLHLLAYPALIWLVSRLFFNYTFRYGQTFEFALNEHGSKLAFLYTIPVMLYLFFQRKIQPIPSPDKPPLPIGTENWPTTLIVSENNQKTSLAMSDILYFSANSPYVTIHHKTRKYVLSDTLKSLASRLNPADFVRIHKSVLVNMQQVTAYKSRLNGDYDLTLSEGTQLRVSRHYAATFKATFERTHPVTAENPPVTRFGL